MAGFAGDRKVRRPTERLIALEGVNGGALTSAARTVAAANRAQRPNISAWDASGIFGEVTLANVGAGDPSARTLLLLYAADLAFRVRWDVTPALAAGRLVIVAPYIDTAIAFGRAAGLDESWLSDMFHFAPLAATTQHVTAAAAHTVAERTGFVEFGNRMVLGEHAGEARLTLMKRTRANLTAQLESRAGQGTL